MSQGVVITTITGITDTGLVRTNNEDCLLISDPHTGQYLGDNVQLTHSVSDNRLLLIVSDGMGGAEGGEIASRLTTYVLQTELPRLPRRLSAQSRLGAAIEEANNLVRQERLLDRRLQAMGATVTAMLIEHDIAYIGEVGDSRAYIMRNGRLKQLTTDQTMIQVMLDAGMITPQAAARSNNRNILLQAVGAQDHLQIAVNSIELRREDILLLCSDGLSGKLSTDEMADIIRVGGSLTTIAKQLVEAAKRRGGEDNISVILAYVDGDGLRDPNAEPLTRAIKVLSRFDPEQEAQPKDKLVMRPATLEDWMNAAVIDYYAHTSAQKRKLDTLQEFGDYVVCRRGDTLTVSCDPLPDTIYCLLSGRYRLEVEAMDGRKQTLALLISPVDRRSDEEICMGIGMLPVRRQFFVGSLASLGGAIRSAVIWCEDNKNAMFQIPQRAYLKMGEILGERFFAAVRYF
ncbi:MAG: protein phosphatase 2C domain-containing protein [Acidobacteriota bacterium]